MCCHTNSQQPCIIIKCIYRILSCSVIKSFQLKKNLVKSLKNEPMQKANTSRLCVCVYKSSISAAHNWQNQNQLCEIADRTSELTGLNIDAASWSFRFQLEERWAARSCQRKLWKFQPLRHSQS